MDQQNLKNEYKKLAKKFDTEKLNFSLENESFLMPLLEFTKDNYDLAMSFMKDVLSADSLEYNLIKDKIFSLKNRKTINLFVKKHDKIIELIRNNYKSNYDVINKFEDYMILLFYINSKIEGLDTEDKDKYFNKIIDNFKSLKDLGFESVNFDFLGDSKYTFTLDAVPEGSLINVITYSIVYKEENFFTDGQYEDDYNKNEGLVDITVTSPSYIIKNGYREIDSLLSFDGYSHSSWLDITIYDLDFDNKKLPTKEQLKNTKCDLPSYQRMTYDKQIAILQDKIEETWSLIERLDKKIDFVFELSDEIRVKDFTDKETLGKIIENLSIFDELSCDLPLEVISEDDETLDEKPKCLIKKINNVN